MKTTFNLRKHIKKAFYEDHREYWQKETRAWMNAYKAKRDEGLSPHDAWTGCLEEYQKGTLLKINE